MTNEIQWQDGAVCYAKGKQIFSYDEECLLKPMTGVSDTLVSFGTTINSPDFQLNAIRTGDFIAASELDTEQKYNDVVEVFGLFGFPRYEGCTFKEEESAILVADEDGDFVGKDFADQYCKRQLTYQQIMTIGKLKRMSDEKNSTEDNQSEEENRENTSDYDSHPKINHCDLEPLTDHKLGSAVSTVNRDIERDGEDSGFSCDYYKVHIDEPTTGSEPYTAECNDLIEALDMTYAEANMFKEIWRTASARTLGKKKAGHTSKRGAEKIIFFAARHGIKHGVTEND